MKATCQAHNQFRYLRVKDIVAVFVVERPFERADASRRARRRASPLASMTCWTCHATPAAPLTRVCGAGRSKALQTKKRSVWTSRHGRGVHLVPTVLPSTAELETAQLASIAGFGVLIGSFAVGLGLKGEPEPCPACAQRGGEDCIFCDATGRRDAPVNISKRDRNDDSVMGLTRRSPLECTACKGAGMILCKTCRGTGFK